MAKAAAAAAAVQAAAKTCSVGPEACACRSYAMTT